MQLPCQHDVQNPDFQREVWVCAICGEDTLHFWKPDRIARENADCNASAAETKFAQANSKAS
jgi:hypothetical protein